jgi:hypothetical protein
MARKKKTNAGRKYAKQLSLYPLKPEEALRAFMQVDPKKILARERRIKKK